MILVYLIMACFAIVLVGAMVWFSVQCIVEIVKKYRELREELKK